MEGNLHNGLNFWQYTLSYFAWKNKCSVCDYTLIYSLYLIVGIDGQRFGRSMIRKLVQKTFDKEICAQIPSNGQRI